MEDRVDITSFEILVTSLSDEECCVEQDMDHGDARTMCALDTFALELGEVATLEGDVNSVEKAHRKNIKAKLVQLLEEHCLLEMLVLVEVTAHVGKGIVIILGGVVYTLRHFLLHLVPECVLCALLNSILEHDVGETVAKKTDGVHATATHLAVGGDGNHTIELCVRLHDVVEKDSHVLDEADVRVQGGGYANV
jgi:hypothetical protein